MPCRSDYMEPSGQELESKRVCELIIYLRNRLGLILTAKWITDAAASSIGNVNRLDEATKILCSACRSLTEEEVEKYIYDGHNTEARRLAGWWDRHQEWDERRVAEEDAAKKKATLRERALNKLTPEEMQALGLID